MAIVTLPDDTFTAGDPVRITGRRGLYRFAGRRQNEHTGAEWYDVWDKEMSRISVPVNGLEQSPNRGPGRPRKPVVIEMTVPAKGEVYDRAVDDFVPVEDAPKRRRRSRKATPGAGTSPGGFGQ